MKLKDSTVRSAKPREKNYKLYDERGLYLFVKTTGSKLWRYKYRFDGKEKVFSLGPYPDVSLASARKKLEEARVLLAKGIDPMAQKLATKAAKREGATNSFETIAREWLIKRGPKSASGDARLTRILEKDLYPQIGAMPVAEITPTILLKALELIESRGAVQTAHKAKQCAGQVFRYAIATGRADRDPSADLKGALKTVSTNHHSALVHPQEVADLMRAIHAYQATPSVMLAIRLAPYIFCRPGELRKLEWSEINFDEARIEIPASKMKLNEPHIIPLSTQALAILTEARGMSWQSKYVFPNARSNARPMSDNALRVALRTMGYTNEQMTPHGFRAMARTLLDEVLEFPADWIEHQLAHAVRDANGRAYNRTRHLEGRRKMMQMWADYLDRLRRGKADVATLKKGHRL